jgi:hypothetical protein
VRKLSLDRAKHTPHDPNRAALGGEFTSGLATRPASRAQGPHRTPTSRHFSYMPTRARLTTRTKPAIARPERTTNTRDTWPSSAAQLRAPPRLPHFNFLLSVVRRREPPARAASRSTEDRESRSALLAPADDRDAQPAPRSRPVKPRTREQEPRSPPPNDRAPSLVHENADVFVMWPCRAFPPLFAPPFAPTAEARSARLVWGGDAAEPPPADAGREKRRSRPGYPTALRAVGPPGRAFTPP